MNLLFSWNIQIRTETNRTKIWCNQSNIRIPNFAESSGVEPHPCYWTKQVSNLSLSPSRFTLLYIYLRKCESTIPMRLLHAPTVFPATLCYHSQTTNDTFNSHLENHYHCLLWSGPSNHHIEILARFSCVALLST